MHNYNTIQYNTFYWQLPTRGFSVTIYNSRGNQIDIAQIAICKINVFYKSNQIKSNQMLVFGERGKPEYPGKTSHSRVENQQKLCIKVN